MFGRQPQPPVPGYPQRAPGGAYPQKPRTSKKRTPKPPFFTPFTIRGRRHLSAAIIVAGIIVSTVYQSGVIQSAIESVKDTVGISDEWSPPKR